MMSSTLSVFEQIGHAHAGVCSFIMKKTSASKQPMCEHTTERIGVLMREPTSCGVGAGSAPGQVNGPGGLRDP